MIRMLGVLCGAAIAIALLTWLVGVPQFTQERSSAPGPVARVELPGAIERTDKTLPEAAPAADVAAQETVSGDLPEPAVSERTQEAPREEIATVEIKPDPGAAPVVDLPGAPAAVQAGIASFEPDAVPDVPAEAVDDSKWFAFWSPFRSELAANGFVTRLQSVTGLDYRVVRIKPGVYEVAFAYTDDDEIDTKLATISSATGLKLAGAP